MRSSAGKCARCAASVFTTNFCKNSELILFEQSLSKFECISSKIVKFYDVGAQSVTVRVST